MTAPERAGATGAVTPGSDEAKRHPRPRFEDVISGVLRTGVSLSAALITAGLSLMLAHHRRYATLAGHFSYRRLAGPGFPFPHSLGGLVAAVSRGEGRGIAALGLVVLILTPVTRVAVSVVAFALARDRAMTLVTCFVLAALAGSFVIGAASA